MRQTQAYNPPCSASSSRPAAAAQQLSAARGAGRVPAPQRRSAALGSRAVACAAERERKDPRQFESMDAARDYLHSQGGGGGFVAGALNWLSNAAFGGSKEGQGGLGQAYKRWLRAQWQPPAQRRLAALEAADAERKAAVAAASAQQPDLIPNLALVLLISERRATELAERCPQILSLPPAEVAQRLVAWKALLPWQDITDMVIACPPLLGCDAEFVRSTVARRVELLKQALNGADLATMVQEHPWVLLEDIEAAIPQLQDLWPGLDAEVYAECDPAELALALRALAKQNLPRSY